LITMREGVIETVLQKFGGIDILVNNAGSQYSNSVLDYQKWDYINSFMLMNYTPFVLSQTAARHMLAHNGGHIINILSTAAFQGARNIVGYVAAKHGLLGLTRALAVELAPKIAVNAIAPGLTNTDMTLGIDPERRALLESITPAGRFCEPDEIAAALMFLVNSTGIYGQTITVDGGWMVKNG
jgi:2-deoxy-D-gluconate 3-dehydrogenase